MKDEIVNAFLLSFTDSGHKHRPGRRFYLAQN